jgi:tripartite-type tricarboxylate transporter receptor subunit TctC
MHPIRLDSSALKYPLGTLALSLPLAAPPGAAAAAYPERPIRFLVGVVPGGATDILARAVGQRLSERFQQQAVVENRPGANQTIAVDKGIDRWDDWTARLHS